MADQKLRVLDRRYAQEPTLENAQALDAEAQRQGVLSRPRRHAFSALLYAVKNMPVTLRFPFIGDGEVTQEMVVSAERVYLNEQVLIPAIDQTLLSLDDPGLSLTDRQKVERLRHGDYAWRMASGYVVLTLHSHLAVLPEDELVIEAFLPRVYREGTIRQLQEHQRLLERMSRVRVNPDYYASYPALLDPARFGGLRDE